MRSLWAIICRREDNRRCATCHRKFPFAHWGVHDSLPRCDSLRRGTRFGIQDKEGGPISNLRFGPLPDASKPGSLPVLRNAMVPDIVEAADEYILGMTATLFDGEIINRVSYTMLSHNLRAMSPCFVARICRLRWTVGPLCILRGLDGVVLTEGVG